MRQTGEKDTWKSKQCKTSSSLLLVFWVFRGKMCCTRREPAHSRPRSWVSRAPSCTHRSARPGDAQAGPDLKLMLTHEHMAVARSAGLVPPVLSSDTSPQPWWPGGWRTAPWESWKGNPQALGAAFTSGADVSRYTTNELGPSLGASVS